jgi:hypothetical protein
MVHPRMIITSHARPTKAAIVRRALRRGAAAMTTALAAALLTAASGCNIVGPALLIVEGPPTNEAVFKLDETRTHVIFIDDLKSRVPKRSLRTEIATSAEQALLEEKVLAQEQLIATSAIMRVAADDAFGAPMSVAQMGERVGADVVIDVSREEWTLTQDRGTYTPKVVALVKIIDAETKQRIWPKVGSGHRLTVEPRDQTNAGEVPKDLASRTAAEQALAKRCGKALAELFFEHEVRKASTNR